MLSNVLCKLRFKLPRTKYSFDGLRTAVGDYILAGLPNITGSFGVRKSGTSSNTIFDKQGALSGTATTTDISTPISTSGTTVESQPIGFNASLSNSIYGNSSTVQVPATQMYLEFYLN